MTQAEKSAIRNRVRKAVKRGQLIKTPCKKCGAVNVHGHHEDYNKPLEVDWLCPDCHRGRHKELKQKGAKYVYHCAEGRGRARVTESTQC